MVLSEGRDQSTVVAHWLVTLLGLQNFQKEVFEVEILHFGNGIPEEDLISWHTNYHRLFRAIDVQQCPLQVQNIQLDLNLCVVCVSTS